VIASHPEFARWLLDSLRSGLLAVDRNPSLVALSPEAAGWLGLEPPRPEAWLGQPAARVLRSHPRILALLREALEGREQPGRAELALQAGEGGGPRTLGFTLVSVRDGEGRVQGAALLFRDLTPFESADEQARLRDRLAALGQMAAGLAHEIRNPLASLEVLAGLLKRQLGDRPEDLELVEELLAELRLLTATVNARLDFVRPAAPSPRPVEALSLIEEGLARARARVPFQGRVEIEPGEPGLSVFTDPEQLRSVLADLFVNAFQAMASHEPRDLRQGHCLRVALARSREGGTSVSVSDTGPGVPEELRERIFNPFFTTRSQGTGVGLAEAQKVLASHGGTLSVRGEAGQGATFLLHLPPEVPLP